LGGDGRTSYNVAASHADCHHGPRDGVARDPVIRALFIDGQ